MTPLEALWAQAGLIAPAGLLFLAGICVAIGHRGGARGLAITGLLAGALLFLGALWHIGDAFPIRAPIGGWAAPFGIEARIDHLSILIGGLIFWAAGFAFLFALGQKAISFSAIVGVLILAAAAGFSLVLGDMASLWLALTLAGGGAVALAADRPGAAGGAYRLLMVSGVGAVLHAVGVVFLIAAAGSSALSDLAGQTDRLGGDPLFAAGLACVFVGVMAQGGLFPFHTVAIAAARGAPRGADQALAVVLNLAALGVLARWVDVIGSVKTAPLAVMGALALTIWGAIGALACAGAAVRARSPRAIVEGAFAAATMMVIMLMASGGRMADAGLVLLIGATIGALAAGLALDAGGLERNAPLEAAQGLAARAPLTAIAALIGFAGLAGLPLTVTFLAIFEALGLALLSAHAWIGATIALVFVLLATAALRFGEQVLRSSDRAAAATSRGALVAGLLLCLALVVAAWTPGPLFDLALQANASHAERAP